MSWSCTVQSDNSSFHTSLLSIGAECNDLADFFPDTLALTIPRVHERLIFCSAQAQVVIVVA